MKKLLAFLAVFLSTSVVFAGPVTGTVVRPGGNVAVPSARLVISLANCQGTPVSLNASGTPPSTITLTANGSGVVSGTILGNDLIQCDNRTTTWYQVNAFTPTGILLYTKVYSVGDSAGLNLQTSTVLANLSTSNPNFLYNPMTAAGDILVGGLGGLPTKLALGATGTCFISNGSAPVWDTCPSGGGGGGGGSGTVTGLSGDVTAFGTGIVGATLASVGTSGNYYKVHTDTKGRVTSGSTSLLTTDLPFTYTGPTTKLVTSNGSLATGNILAIDSSGNAIAATNGSSFPGTSAFASAFDHTPSPCSAGAVTGISASGVLSCNSILFSDVSGTISSSQLPSVNSNIGTCGDSTHIPQVSLNVKGQTTACTPIAISAGSSLPSGAQYKMLAYLGAGTSTTVGAVNATTDSTGNQLNIPIASGNYNAFSWLTGGGSNGIANAFTAGASTVIAGANYTGGEPYSFGPNNTVFTENRSDGMWNYLHGTLYNSYLQDHQAAGTACLFDTRYNTTSYGNNFCNGTDSYWLGYGSANMSNTGVNDICTSAIVGVNGCKTTVATGLHIDDFQYMYNYVNFVPGASFGADESQGYEQMHMYQVPWLFTGTGIASAAGQTTITTTATSPGFGQGGNGQYAGGALMNITDVLDTGNILGSTINGSSLNLLTTSTTHAVTTAYGIIPGDVNNPTDSVNGTVTTITVVLSAGSFPTSGSFNVCLAGVDANSGQHAFWEEAVATSAGTPSGGNQTVTLPLRWAHGASTLVGLGSCKALTMDINRQVAGQVIDDPVEIIVAAPTSTTYIGARYETGNPANSVATLGSAYVPAAISVGGLTSSRTSNVVTLNIEAAYMPTRLIGTKQLTISGCSNSTFNFTGTVAVTVVGGSNGSFVATYTQPGSNSDAAGVSGCSYSVSGYNAFHVYNVAYVKSISNPTTNTLQPSATIDGTFVLGPYSWNANGKTLEEGTETNSPNIRFDSYRSQTPPRNNSTTSYLNWVWQGAAVSGGFIGLKIQNVNPDSMYLGSGGGLQPPNFAFIDSIYNEGWHFTHAPSGGHAYTIIDCPPTGEGGCSSLVPYRLFSLAGAGTGGYIGFTPGNNTWTLNGTSLTFQNTYVKAQNYHAYGGGPGLGAIYFDQNGAADTFYVGDVGSGSTGPMRAAGGGVYNPGNWAVNNLDINGAGILKWGNAIATGHGWDGSIGYDIFQTRSNVGEMSIGNTPFGYNGTVLRVGAVKLGDTTPSANVLCAPSGTITNVGCTAYATVASPGLTGVPTAPTATGGTNTTQIATTAFVASAISGIGAGYSLGGTLSCSNISFGTGAGTSPSCTSVTGLDGTFQVIFTTGASPVNNQPVMTINFTASRGHATACTLSVSPSNYSVYAQVPNIVNVAPSATSTTITAGTTALVNATIYAYNVTCP